MNTKIILLVTLLFLGPISSANGQIGITAGTEYGFGGIAQVGSHTAKLEIGGGLVPLFVFWQIHGPFVEKNYFKLYFPGVVGAKLSVALTKPDRKDRLGVKLGASYNTIMKVGFGGGVDYSIAKKSHRIVISAGFMIYPDAYDELLDRFNEEEETSYTKEDVSAALMSFQPFVSVSLLFGK